MEEKLAREKWDRYHRYMRMEEVDGMSGTGFEDFLGGLLQKLGHTDVRRTAVSGDQGADLLCVSPDNKRVVVQAKCWKGSVGNSAVQEVMEALAFYDAEIAFVVTNRSFTDQACALAARDPRIHLVGRTKLAEMMRNVFPKEVPEFDQQKYDLYVAGWIETFPRCAAPKLDNAEILRKVAAGEMRPEVAKGCSRRRRHPRQSRGIGSTGAGGGGGDHQRTPVTQLGRLSGWPPGRRGSWYNTD